jgi:pimeloyl-ACP methyl ester carboxylesterase
MDYRLPLKNDSCREISHLAVRFDEPAEAGGLPCFLYLHGLGSDQAGEKAEFFRAQAKAEGFPFCSFDFQGHGGSGGTMRGLTLSRNLLDVAQVQRWLAGRGHTRIVLLGSSMGGGTALWYSALYPEGIVAGLHIAPALEIERSLLEWAGAGRARAWQESGVLQFQGELVECELGWELIDDLRRYPVDRLLAEYRTPCLIVQGRRDLSVPWRGVADFAAGCAFSEIELHLFADGDHRLTDRKARLWALMREFLHGRGIGRR